MLPTSRASVVVRRILAVLGAVVIVWLMENERVVIHIGTAVPGLNAGDWLALTYAMVSLGTALVIWELFASTPHLVHRLLGSAPLRGIGRISYALYLFGPPVIFGLTPSFTGLRVGPALTVLHLAAVFTLATASWFVVERRFLKRSGRPEAQPSAGVPS